MSELDLELTETAEENFQEATLDSDTLKDVLFLGKTSKNSREYTENAMNEAVEMYNNIPIYINHKNGERQLEDHFGTSTNVRMTAKGIVGDIKVLTSHPMYNTIKEAYTNQTPKIGMSHDIIGRGKTREDGITEVDKIVKVKSLDIVSKPGTVTNFRETENAELISLKAELVQLKEQIQESLTVTEENLQLKEQVKDLTNDKLLLTAKVTALESKNKWAAPKSFGLEATETEKEIPVNDKDKLAKWLQTK